MDVKEVVYTKDDFFDKLSCEALAAQAGNGERGLRRACGAGGAGKERERPEGPMGASCWGGGGQADPLRDSCWQPGGAAALGTWSGCVPAVRLQSATTGAPR